MCVYVFVYLRACDVSQSQSDTLEERKCESSRPGSVKFPPRVSSSGPGEEVSCGADRVMLWAELREDQGPGGLPVTQCLQPCA